MIIPVHGTTLRLKRLNMCKVSAFLPDPYKRLNKYFIFSHLSSNWSFSQLYHSNMCYITAAYYMPPDPCWMVLIIVLSIFLRNCQSETTTCSEGNKTRTGCYYLHLVFWSPMELKIFMEVYLGSCSCLMLKLRNQDAYFIESKISGNNLYLVY